jgi:hypothetical protein
MSPQNPPLEPPTITIGGRTLTLKFSLLSDYVLDKRGIDTAQIVPTLKSGKPGRSSLIIELFAACVAHNYIEAGEPVPTPEQWCLKVPPEMIRELGKKLIEALFPNLPAPVEEAGGEEKQTPAVQ